MITVQLNEPNFEYDIHSLVKAFYPQHDVLVKAMPREEFPESVFHLVVNYDRKNHMIDFKFFEHNQQETQEEDDAAKEELFEALKPDYITGVTFSGGDPLHPANHAEVAVLAKEIRETFPEKTIWLYTGFCWDEIKTLDVVKYCDVIVDGPFVQEEFDGKLHWKGSKNQRVIDVQETLRGNEIVLHEL